MRRTTLLRLAAGLAFGAAPAAGQSSLAEIEAVFARGDAWHASRLIAPIVGTPATRTPEAVLLAARAAAAWEGWTTVYRLLERESWLDSRFDRAGRRLLAEAALALDRNDQALLHARAAVEYPGSGPSAERGARLTLLARAQDRLNQLDSAALSYLRAAALLPAASEWLSLRAAGVTRDSSARSRLFASVTSTPAVPRIAWTEALARDRADDVPGAVAAYQRLGAPAAALRIRWRAASTDAERTAIAASLVALLDPARPPGQARDALLLLDRLKPPLDREQQLRVARRAAAVGRAAQAVAAFESASRLAVLGDRDRMTHGTMLGQLGRWSDAALQFRGITDPALAGHAAYFRARALLRGARPADASAAFRDVVARFPSDTVAAGTALFLLADFAIDAAQPDSARHHLSTLMSRYPTSAFRARATLLSGLIAFATGSYSQAASDLGIGAQRHGASVEGDAFRYWLARTQLAKGDTAGARSGFTALLAKGPESYYAARAALRLDTMPWTIARAHDSAPDTLAVVFARIDLLHRLGMDVEARFELDHLSAQPRTGPAMVSVGRALFAHGFPNRAIQLGERAAATGIARDAGVMTLLYPLPWAEVLRSTGGRETVDPLLAASVIRQESRFDPRAISQADARGLMQVLPAVGRELGRAFGFPDLDEALLWQPAVNIPIGMRHFSAALRRYPDVERALASYNAGPTPVTRWSRALLNGRAAGDGEFDAELFVERIPFAETRDYVRIVMRNRVIYGMLYGDP